MRKEVVLLFTIVCVASSYAADTELQLYRPFTETPKQLPFNIIEKKIGDCLEQSKIVQREDAWRCTVDRKTYDPCFVKAYGSKTTAVCPLSVWTDKSIKIAVAKPLDNTQHKSLDMSDSYPWAVELVSGEKCYGVEVDGTVDGLPIHYRCNENTVLVGHVHRCETVWHILAQNPNGVSTVDIAKAWF